MSADPIALLLVEDNPVYAEIVQRLLPTLGTDLKFDVTWAETGEQALQKIHDHAYQLVLLDYKLPGLDGLAVLAWIRSLPEERQPAVIILTGMGREEVAVEAMKSGAKDYLAKDSLDLPSLLRAITSALERKRLEHQLSKYTEELAQKNREMRADLDMARELQEALLPQRYPSFPANAAPKESALHFCHRYNPASSVGGDFFDVVALSDTEAGVFICDVMGHGVRAALVTAIVRGWVEELKPISLDPGKFLTEINRRLVSTLRQTRMPMFMSAFYLVMDVAGGEIRFANAGHPNPLHLQREAGVVEPLRFADGKPGPALGVFEDSTYATAQRSLAVGDVVMLFTDGVFEVDSQKQEQYGQDRLLAAVRQRVRQPLAPLLDELLTDIQQFSGETEFVDDVCLVGIEVARIGQTTKERHGG